MKEVACRGGRVALVDDHDYGLVIGYDWVVSRGYAKVTLKGKQILMHRLIMGLVIGKDSSVIVHHRNRNRLDNRRINLITTNNIDHLLHHGRKKDISDSESLSIFDEVYSNFG